MRRVAGFKSICLGPAAVTLTLIRKSESHLDYHKGCQSEKGLPTESLLQTFHCAWGSRPYGLTSLHQENEWKEGKNISAYISALKNLNFTSKNENKSWI